MPKKFNSYSAKLNSYVIEFGKTILQTDGKVLTCQICSSKINGERKCLVKQHLRGKEHKRRLSQTKHRQQQFHFPNEDADLKAYNRKLAEAFAIADIPLNKLNYLALSKFLSEETKKPTPSERNIRRMTEELYNEVIEKIRKEIGRSMIYVEIDETMDAEGIRFYIFCNIFILLFIFIC